jgi:hypothetical protein
VLDGLGAQLDVQTAATIPPEVFESMVVGRRSSVVRSPTARR